MATAEALLTAEEFERMPDPGYPTELVRGRIVAMNPPGFRHGAVCVNIVRIVGGYLDRDDRGRLVSNDSGTITERGPDTVRGMDVGYYSYERLPREKRPQGYPGVSPDAVFEVKSPSDRWSDLLEKTAEYLKSGVIKVCIVDPQRRTVTIYSQDEPERALSENDIFELPEIFPGLSVPVARFFE